MSQTPLADEIARISRDEFQRYLDQFAPLEQKTIQTLDESTVGKAGDMAAEDAVRARAALGRMRDRYGTDVSPMQAAGEARQNALSGALGEIGASNTAVLADRDRERQTLVGLLKNGQQFRQQAMGNYGSAAGMESSRASANTANSVAYSQQKAANKASTIQSVASLGAMAMMATL